MSLQQSPSLQTDQAASDSRQRRDRRTNGVSRLRRPLVATGAVLALLLGWTLAETYVGNARLPSEIRDEFEQSSTVGIVVTLDFEPERFHLNYFQERASLRNVENTTIYLQDVSEDTAKDIASEYWVSDIQLWDDG